MTRFSCHRIEKDHEHENPEPGMVSSLGLVATELRKIGMRTRKGR